MRNTVIHNHTKSNFEKISKKNSQMQKKSLIDGICGEVVPNVRVVEISGR